MWKEDIGSGLCALFILLSSTRMEINRQFIYHKTLKPSSFGFCVFHRLLLHIQLG